jgi:CBS domain containing-hemolysin-like protein
MNYTRISGFLIEADDNLKVIGDVIVIDGVDFEIKEINTYNDDGVDRVHYELEKVAEPDMRALQDL